MQKPIFEVLTYEKELTTEIYMGDIPYFATEVLELEGELSDEVIVVDPLPEFEVVILCR